MLLTLDPRHNMRYRETPCGLEAEMSREEAIKVLDGPIVINGQRTCGLPTCPDCVSNRASALYILGRTVESLEVAYRALAMRRSVPSLVNVAVILETMGEFEAALVYAKEAYEFDPKDNRASSIYGEGLLRLGKFREGWPHYVKNRTALEWLKPLVREWEGPHQSVQGKRFLVVEGGGYGDNVYFLRWLAYLKRWGASVDFICQPPFAPLVDHIGYRPIPNWQGNIQIRYSDYDYFSGILAFGWKMGLNLNTRWDGPYIKPTWRGKLRSLVPGVRIGLCWRAGEASSPRKQRSLTKEQVEEMISRMPSCTLVNLTQGENLEPPIQPANFTNWLETADAIAKCDLVIAVDTGVAHLAGAMGIPVWVPLPGASAWQYPLGCDVHPFYPSMRCFWNRGEGMTTCVEQICEELTRL